MTDTIVNIIHLLATAVWIGGMFFIHFILQPSMNVLDPHQGGLLMGGVAKRFTIAAWTSTLALIITGIMKTPDGMMFDTSTETGIILTAKHVMIALMIAAGLVISLSVAPALRNNPPKPGEPPGTAFVRAQGRLRVLSTTNLVLGVLVIICAAQLW